MQRSNIPPRESPCACAQCLKAEPALRGKRIPIVTAVSQRQSPQDRHRAQPSVEATNNASRAGKSAVPQVQNLHTVALPTAASTCTVPLIRFATRNNRDEQADDVDGEDGVHDDVGGKEGISPSVAGLQPDA